MKLTYKQKAFLDEVVDGTWSINPYNGLVDVKGSVDMSNKYLIEIPVKFGEVSGYLSCDNNKLTNLFGAPQSVGGDFYCSYNQLTTLKGAPQSVRSYLDCSYNQLINLVGAPKSVGGGFNCRFNQLTSLEGAPHLVGGLFVINLGDIDKRYHPLIIPEIEEIVYKGIRLYNPEEYYYPYREIYYNNKLIELL
jgi:hypothetical protein